MPFSRDVHPIIHIHKCDLARDLSLEGKVPSAVQKSDGGMGPHITFAPLGRFLPLFTQSEWHYGVCTPPASVGPSFGGGGGGLSLVASPSPRGGFLPPELGFFCPPPPGVVWCRWSFSSSVEFNVRVTGPSLTRATSM